MAARVACVCADQIAACSWACCCVPPSVGHSIACDVGGRCNRAQVWPWLCSGARVSGAGLCAVLCVLIGVVGGRRRCQLWACAGGGAPIVCVKHRCRARPATGTMLCVRQLWRMPASVRLAACVRWSTLTSHSDSVLACGGWPSQRHRNIIKLHHQDAPSRCGARCGVRWREHAMTSRAVRRQALRAVQRSQHIAPRCSAALCCEER